MKLKLAILAFAAILSAGCGAEKPSSAGQPAPLEQFDAAVQEMTIAREPCARYLAAHDGSFC